MRVISGLIMLISIAASCQNSTPDPGKPSQPGQLMSGYGGSSYQHEEVIKKNYDDGPTGYWLYLPSSPAPALAPVIVFNHGYGGWNPANYGAWIKHLVRQGNIVIYPRYQKDARTKPAEFTPNAAAAIKRALKVLASDELKIKAETDKLIIIGHSYGGVVSANLALNAAELGVPMPKGIFLAAAGVGPVPSGQAKSYAGLSESLKLLMIIEKQDTVVDSVFMKKVYNESQLVKAANKALLMHLPDGYGSDSITAEHNEPTGADLDFDSKDGKLAASPIVDATDYYCYWRLADALIDCSRNNKGCPTAFTDTKEQTFMGKWSDGVEVKRLTGR
ncbi:alpha/beta hydrolase [Dyadobacter sp. CY399]|uniref:Alpha/beta hydrolase n=2 Tax=Dyadobacter fanqingshengii TaxID=2906443 RepID=A0A9X1PDR2_9BACT|nr:alpha/beta hydrolase [Dyadobacter fanqingshengii]MCF0042028.1 alpha/beta hydrolase [Dyadobacter fanqingshengii]